MCVVMAGAGAASETATSVLIAVAVAVIAIAAELIAATRLLEGLLALVGGSGIAAALTGAAADCSAAATRWLVVLVGGIGAAAECGAADCSAAVARLLAV